MTQWIDSELDGNLYAVWNQRGENIHGTLIRALCRYGSRFFYEKGEGKVKAVFLDIDNTLLSFDEYVKQTMKEGFAHFDLKKYEPSMFEDFTKVNNHLWQMIELGTLTFTELEKIRWNQVFQILGIDFDGVIFEKYFRDALYESAIPEDGVYELLDYLQGKYIICAASNGPYEQQVHRLEIANMRKYFDYIFISEKAGVSKPSKGFYDYAFRELNNGRKEVITPDACMMIGDSLTSDIEGGQMYGMKTCLYRRNKAAEVPDGVTVADTLQDVLKVVKAEGR